MITLADMYNGNYDEAYDQDDLEYRLYIQDHKPQLLLSGTVVQLNANQQARYNYRPRLFLYENKYPELGDWILLFVNDMTGPMEFKNISQLIVPNWKYIETVLYATYRTLSSKMNAAKKILVS